jgi:hypothetical protein
MYGHKPKRKVVRLIGSQTVRPNATNLKTFSHCVRELSVRAQNRLAPVEPTDIPYCAGSSFSDWFI